MTDASPSDPSISSAASAANAPVRRIEVAGLSALSIGADDAPLVLVFLHANGFHAALYADLLAPLATGRRILAPDHRGHGRTTLPADPETLTDWGPLIDDAVRLLESLDGPVVLAGHSLGASTAAFAAKRRPDLVRGLALIEPVVGETAFHIAMRTSLGRKLAESRMRIAKGALMRRRRFDSVDAALASYTGRGAFRTWPTAALRAYVEEGFKPAEDEEGGVVLRCDPKWEAAIYVGQGHDLWGAFRAAPRPFVVRAGETMSTFPAFAERRLKAMRPDVDFERIDGATHFLPLERPDVARAAIDQVLQATGV